LIAQAQKGSTEALEQLLRQYQNYIYAIALGILRTPCDAEDAAQEAMLRIFKALPKFRLEASFSTWIYRITINCCTDMLRKNARKQTVPLEEAAEAADCLTPDELLERTRITEQMHAAIEKLDEEYKQIILLREMQRLSYDELAVKLNCSLPAVKSRLYRARVQLRDICKKMQIF